MANQPVGHIRSIAINDHKVSFILDPLAAGEDRVRLVLVNEPAGAHTIPQVQLAHRSWMFALLQTAMVQKQIVKVTHDDDKEVSQVELIADLNLDFDFGKKDEKDTGGGLHKPPEPGPIQKDHPSPPGPGRRPVR